MLLMKELRQFIVIFALTLLCSFPLPHPGRGSGEGKIQKRKVNKLSEYEYTKRNKQCGKSRC